jgi:UDP-N-acetylglucosamine acyltransferase
VIHPTAIVHPKANLDADVQVGPYAVIDEGLEIGPGCIIGPHAYLTGLTRIGARNRFYASCVIGEAPQDLKYRDEPTRLVIGDDNVFREHTTVHRSTKPAEVTVIGSRNFLMAGAHVGHNCRLGNGVIMANGSMLGGHASVDDGAFISGSCLVHQFIRVGALAMMQGGAAVSADLPPYTMVRRVNELCGLNIVGLRRSGLSPADRLELKHLYHLLFRGGLNRQAALAQSREKFSSASAKVMIEFVAAAKRSLCADKSERAGGEEDSL